MTELDQLRAQLAEALEELHRMDSAFEAERKAADVASKEVIQLMTKLVEAQAEIERLKATPAEFPAMLDAERARYIGREIRYQEEIEHLRDWSNHLNGQLAASQATNEKLRQAIDVVLSDAEECEDHDGWLANLVSCEAIHQLDEVFELPNDTTALREIIAEEIEAIKRDWYIGDYTGCVEDFLQRRADAFRELAEKAKC